MSPFFGSEMEEMTNRISHNLKIKRFALIIIISFWQLPSSKAINKQAYYKFMMTSEDFGEIRIDTEVRG